MQALCGGDHQRRGRKSEGPQVNRSRVLRLQAGKTSNIPQLTCRWDTPPAHVRADGTRPHSASVRGSVWN